MTQYAVSSCDGKKILSEEVGCRRSYCSLKTEALHEKTDLHKCKAWKLQQAFFIHARQHAEPCSLSVFSPSFSYQVENCWIR